MRASAATAPELETPTAAPDWRGARSVAVNTLLNVLGSLLPLAAAYFAMPALARGLGVDRFGVLTLGWAVLGYLTLFDLGMGRTLTKVVADGIAARRAEELAPTVWTAVWILGAFGVALAAVAALAAPTLAARMFAADPALRGEALAAFYVLACAAPVLLVGAALRGVLEGAQRFDIVNAVRVPTGLFTFLGPVLVLPFSSRVGVIMLALLAGRAAAAGAQLVLARRVIPALRTRVAPEGSAVRPLLTAGAWMTAGSMLAPLMMTADRFLIAGMLSVAAVGYYTAPYEVVTKLWLIPGAVSAAVFPAFAGGLAENRTLRALYDSALKATFIALVPPVLVLVAFAHEGLAAWMGPEFAAQGAWVVRWLALGVLVNSVAQIPHALLQSSGRAAAVAKLHALELPAYLIALVLLVRAYGVSGAAFAWAARATVDAAALLHLSRGAASPGAPRAALPGSLGGLLLGVGCLGALLALPTPLPVRTVALALALAAFTAAAWRFTLLPRERAALVQRARRRPAVRAGRAL